MVRRKFIDPPRNGEPRFALFSYIDTLDSELLSFLNGLSLTDDDRVKLESIKNKRIKGVAKIRGAFYSQEEAEKRAEELIKDVDSTNSIFTCVIGSPFPLVASGFAAETSEIDLQQQTEHAIAQNVKDKRQKEKKEMEEIRQRQEELEKDISKPTDEANEEEYIQHRVKLAHLRYAIQEHSKKGQECLELERKCVEWLVEMKGKHPEFETSYLQKYMKARRAAGIPEVHDFEGFMKYLNEPIAK
jgi:DNA repair exonuclease SbcCD ATPase subunit